MSSFNKVSLFGNVGKDVEVKRLEGDKIVAKFSLATSEIHGQGEEKTTETQWHNIVCWKKLAELSEKYVKKGMAVIVDGKIVYRNYENKDGQKVYITEIIADKIYFTGKKETETTNQVPDKQGEWQGKKEVKSMSDINSLPGADDIGDMPF
jgi:single-strand DNA-binding protein